MACADKSERRKEPVTLIYRNQTKNFSRDPRKDDSGLSAAAVKENRTFPLEERKQRVEFNWLFRTKGCSRSWSRTAERYHSFSLVQIMQEMEAMVRRHRLQHKQN